MGNIEASNTRVWALSVDTPDKSAGFRKAMDFPFELLCDVDKKVIRLYHLLNPFEHNGIAYPAVFVLNPKGKIGYRSLDDTAGRVQFGEVLKFLEKLRGNPDYEEIGTAKKAFIIPKPAELWQIMQNMLFRGSGADWKHYFMFTCVYTPRNLYRLVSKPFRRK
jgi:alkyl hydroperoxide reductase subunit AhpC